MFAYGMKLWGRVIGDSSMEARGNLMLSILARSLQNYFLMASDNTVQPRNFIDNKVTGIVSILRPSDVYSADKYSYLRTRLTIPPTSAATLNMSRGEE